MKASDDRLWSRRELAAYLGVAVRTVERMRIPRIELPGAGGKRPMIRYDPAEVKEWLRRDKFSRPGKL